MSAMVLRLLDDGAATTQDDEKINYQRFNFAEKLRNCKKMENKMCTWRKKKK